MRSSYGSCVLTVIDYVHPKSSLCSLELFTNYNNRHHGTMYQLIGHSCCYYCCCRIFILVVIIIIIVTSVMDDGTIYVWDINEVIIRKANRWE